MPAAHPVQQTSLLLFCVLLFWQAHSSRIEEVLKSGDSMISLHRICQIPTNQTARETFVNFFPSPEKFLFCTGTTESIEWLNLVPRLSIYDCSEIHILR